MLFIGVGGLVMLIGVLAYLVVRAAVIEDVLAARYLAIPFLILLLGVLMVVKGVRGMRST